MASRAAAASRTAEAAGSPKELTDLCTRGRMRVRMCTRVGLRVRYKGLGRAHQRFGEFSFPADAEEVVVRGVRGGRRDLPGPIQSLSQASKIMQPELSQSITVVEGGLIRHL